MNIEEVSIMAMLSFILLQRQNTEMMATMVRIKKMMKAARK